MKLTTLNLFIAVFLVCILIGVPIVSASGKKEAPRIALDQAKDMLNKPGVVFIDVRTDKDWVASDMKISGAVREEPKQSSEWMGKYSKDKTLIFYCA
jgi:hypothetical protein